MKDYEKKWELVKKINESIKSVDLEKLQPLCEEYGSMLPQTRETMRNDFDDARKMFEGAINADNVEVLKILQKTMPQVMEIES